MRLSNRAHKILRLAFVLALGAAAVSLTVWFASNAESWRPAPTVAPTPHARSEECILQQQPFQFKPDEQLSEEIIKHNLDPDFAIWESRRLSSTDFWRMAEDHADNDNVKLMAIIDGELYFPRAATAHAQTHCNQTDGTCNEQYGPMLEMFATAMSNGWSVPDIAWFNNVQDMPKCWRHNDCSVPMFSTIKMTFNADILFPYPRDSDNPIVTYPWDCKEPKAVWRGTGFCTGHHHKFVVCSRSHLSRLSLAHKDVLDFGMVHEYGPTKEYNFFDGRNDPGPLQGLPDGVLHALPPMPVADLAKFKYAVSVDGHSASSRFGKLLLQDSVVLKQKSLWMEWYYRSLVPDKHYVEFWTQSSDDILDVIKRLERNDTHARRVAEEGQAFAKRNLSLSMKFAYWKYALERYRQLFDDMPAIIDRIKREFPIGKEPSKPPSPIRYIPNSVPAEFDFFA